MIAVVPEPRRIAREKFDERTRLDLLDGDMDHIYGRLDSLGRQMSYIAKIGVGILVSLIATFVAFILNLLAGF